jgi:hypothetical protein
MNGCWYKQGAASSSSSAAYIGKAGSSSLQTFEELKSALDLHARFEELHVYPVFQQTEITRDSEAKVLEAHRKIKVLLEELAGMPRVD